jgi:hypothetical protein
MVCSFLAGATTADYSVLNAAISGGKSYGVFGTPMVSIEDGSISVEAMSGLFPSGVFMSEDVPTSVTAPTPTASATNYTVVWALDPSLAMQPSLSVLNGIVLQSTATDYIVLGWLYHPGSNLAMSTEMFVQAPPVGAPTLIVDFDADAIYSKLLAANYTERVSPNYTERVSTTSPGAAVSITRSRDGQVLITSGSDAQQTLVLPLLIPVREHIVQSLVLDVQLSAQAWITWTRVHTVSGIVTTSSIPYAALSGEIERQVLQLPFARQVQENWSMLALELTLTLGAGASASLSRIAATTLPAAVLTQL